MASRSTCQGSPPRLSAAAGATDPSSSPRAPLAGGDFLPAQLLNQVCSRPETRRPRSLCRSPDPSVPRAGTGSAERRPASPAGLASSQPCARPVPAGGALPAASRDPLAEPPWHEVRPEGHMAFWGSNHIFL